MSTAALSPDLLAPSQRHEAPAGRRRMGDVGAVRQAIYDTVLDSAQNLPTVQNVRHSLSLTNPRYEGPDDIPLVKQKETLLSGGSLTCKLKGTWALKDVNTGKTLAEKDATIARIPHLTQRGTFILNGNELAVNHQLRLLPGVYTRRRSTGEIESHVNVLPTSGVSHRLYLEPSTGH